MYVSLYSQFSPFFYIADMKLFLSNDQRLEYTGLVEVEINGMRGRVCDSNWDDTDAAVVCKQLGYKGGVKYLVS